MGASHQIPWTCIYLDWLNVPLINSYPLRASLPCFKLSYWFQVPGIPVGKYYMKKTRERRHCVWPFPCPLSPISLPHSHLIITATKATPDFSTADQFFHIVKYQAEQILFADFSVTCVWKRLTNSLGCLCPAVFFSQQLPGWFKNQTCKHDTSPSRLLLLPNQMICSWHPPQLLTLVCPLIPTYKLPACSSPLPRLSYRHCHCSFSWSSLLNLLVDFREMSISNMRGSYYIFHGKMSPWGEQSKWTDTWQDNGMQELLNPSYTMQVQLQDSNKGEHRLHYFYCVWIILYFFTGALQGFGPSKIGKKPLMLFSEKRNSHITGHPMWGLLTQQESRSQSHYPVLPLPVLSSRILT